MERWTGGRLEGWRDGGVSVAMCKRGDFEEWSGGEVDAWRNEGVEGYLGELLEGWR